MKKNYHILIADNDLYSASSLSNYLKNKENIEVDGVTSDGLRLLNFVESNRPDVIVMDIVLPKEDGLNIIKKIRSETRLKQPIIIVYSALAASKAVTAIMGVGADYFISKPQSFETIYNTINELVGNHINTIKVEDHKTKTIKGDLEDVVTDYLHNFGIPASIRGYRYLRAAIIMAIEDENSLGMVTKIIYPGVAKQYDSTPSRVERAIRHSIESGWNRGKPEFIDSIFGNTFNRIKPTNSEFIATLSDKIRLQMKCCAS